ncbi:MULTISPECIES: ATP-binding protein [unclassified Streptomyces]|uniref:ATP-binding protein n=1 Tax=Streptomyces sp. NBC_00060 TaxID=2975636 RepID=A0AAU2GTY8_9ACTN
MPAPLRTQLACWDPESAERVYSRELWFQRTTPRADVLAGPDAQWPQRCRALAAQSLLAWRLETLADDVVLAGAELVTNALCHGAGKITFRLARTRTDRGVLVAVADQSPAPVRPRRPEPGELSGRGLQLIEALAHRWGVAPRRDGVGKWVWCYFQDLDPTWDVSPQHAGGAR